MRISDRESPAQGKRERRMSPPRVKGLSVISDIRLSICGLYCSISTKKGIIKRAAIISTGRDTAVIKNHLSILFKSRPPDGLLISDNRAQP